jgi:hypothetical protein
VVVLAAVAVFAYRVRTGLFACPPSGDENTFVAYCHGETYGDYDHGAFWYGLEPAARDAASRADVLFLGSSRLQFGFSTAATEKWFSSRSMRHYLLGFGYTETVKFVAPLLAQLEPRAAAYVINVDRFFTNAETPPAVEIFQGKEAARKKYEDKLRWQHGHRLVCGALPALCGDEFAFLRRRDNGHWRLGGHSQAGERLVPTAVSDGPPADADRWEAFSRVAGSFVAELPVPRQCVVLTLVPYKGTRRAEAEAISRSLGLDLVMPDVADLRTFDGSHLDGPSAERWSAAFFDAAGARFDRCVAEAHVKSLIARRPE